MANVEKLLLFSMSKPNYWSVVLNSSHLLLQCGNSARGAGGGRPGGGEGRKVEMVGETVRRSWWETVGGRWWGRQSGTGSGTGGGGRW